jgi:hypothetical protein
MRLPELSRDYWQLLSAEAANAAHPDTFLIPPRAARVTLARGSAAQLMFDIEGIDEEGQVQSGVERMWVIVAEKVADVYVGILDNQPACLEPSDSTYLCFGAEIPFRAEHVINIHVPPKDYADWQLSQPPERVWPWKG